MLFWIKFICTAGVSLSCDMGGKACRGRVAAVLYPLFHKRFFQGLTDWDLLCKQLTLCVTFPFLWKLSSAGVAPLPPSFHKLLNETVTTFAVFPSWMYLLDGEDKCMLSVPFSAGDLHFSRWQSGENCQAVAVGAFMLLGYALWFSSKGE